MRYFTRGWANGELTEDESRMVSEAYTARLQTLASRLPHSMAVLGQGVSLHDASIESVRWKPSAAELHLTLVAGTSEVGYEAIALVYRGAMLGKRRIESLRNAARNREACVLHQEIDVEDDGTLVHRLLFWPNDEVTIDFRELHYTSTPRTDGRVALVGAFVVEQESDTVTVRRRHVLLSVQRALLGEVTPRMRAVVVRHDHSSVRLVFYFDGAIDDVDREAASCVETEVLADMAAPGTVSSFCERIDRPVKIEDSGTWVFARNEEDSAVRERLR